MLTLDFIERVLRAIAGRMSDKLLMAVAFLLYAGGGLALPLTLRWPMPYLVLANLVCTLLAGVLIVLRLEQLVQAADRRHLIEWTGNLRLLNADEFEWLVGEMFRREGWQVRENGSQEKPDGNVDLELTRNDQRVIVQCKRWDSWMVGVDKIREFAGTLAREKLPLSEGIFVTLSNYTEAARREAKKMGMILIDHSELYSRIWKVRRVEPCPICQKPMRVDPSRYGYLLRCIAPDCRGKRRLSEEQGRAIELLMQPPAA